MRSSIGIVGSGVSGLHLGLFLRAHDVPVTIYADKEPDAIRAGKLLNTVAHHHHCLAGEVRFRGDFEHPSSAVDYRVYLPRLMEDFQERGGELAIVPTTGLEDIERLSQRHDLMVVAVGR